MSITPTVRKNELLAILKDNAARHRTVFEAALVGWEQEAKERIEAAAAMLKEGKRRSVYVSVPVPADHTRDYERAIKSIEMEVGDTITLSERDVAQLIQDDWGWKGEWGRSMSSYANDAYVSNYGDPEE